MIVKLDGQISLKDLNQYPILGELAAFVDLSPATEPAAAVLQRLSPAMPGRVATLICFPYAGGNAINFHLLARELARSKIAVYGIEQPGHDLGRQRSPLAEFGELADQVCGEIQQCVPGPILIWGHCAGVALGLAVTRLLEAAGRSPVAVLAGGLLLEHPRSLRNEISLVTAMTSSEITDQLRTDEAYVELDGTGLERVDNVGAAYRHDVCCANRYLIAAQHDPAGHHVNVPISVVVAADDQSTMAFDRRYRSWCLLADNVDLHVLPDGGHYFVRTRAAETAGIVAKVCDKLTTPLSGK